MYVNAYGDTIYLKLSIVNNYGDVYVTDLDQNFTIERVKVFAIAYFTNATIVSNSNLFKLVSPSQKKTLRDNWTIRSENINDGECLLLLRKFNPNHANNLIIDNKNFSCITKQQIAEATKYVPYRNLNRKELCQPSTTDFIKDVRKMLISLIDYSEKLLKDHPHLKMIFNNLNHCMTLKKDENINETFNFDALQQLVEMGFPLDKSKRALKLNNMNSLEAMDWLLAYQTCTSSAINNNESDKIKISSTINVKKEEKNENGPDIYNQVPAIVKCYRIYKRQTFKVNTTIYENMKKMGFEENEILDSLWVYNNNENGACEWLLSDRRPKYEDLKHGVSRESDLYKALLKNPIIQLGLFKPKILFAFLHLIEEPNGTGKYLNNMETSPILTQIFRVYHSEKNNYNDIQKCANEQISTIDTLDALSNEIQSYSNVQNSANGDLRIENREFNRSTSSSNVVTLV